MIVRRLTWSGLELQTSDATVVVDLLGGRPELSKWAGEPAEELLAPAAAPGTVAAAAVTHLHSDHFDVEALKRALAWKTLGRSRAIENQVAYVGCNSSGRQAGRPYIGASVAYDAWGTCLGELDERPGCYASTSTSTRSAQPVRSSASSKTVCATFPSRPSPRRAVHRGPGSDAASLHR